MIPKKVAKDELLAMLLDMVSVVRADDSFEGSIEYTCLAEHLEPGEFMVQAAYRVGNSMGQGGVVLVGDV